MGGCGSPSVALGLRETDEDTRSSLSASSDDWPWGPDSPDEELEPDVQEFMPRWPLFRRPDGTLGEVALEGVERKSGSLEDRESQKVSSDRKRRDATAVPPGLTARDMRRHWQLNVCSPSLTTIRTCGGCQRWRRMFNCRRRVLRALLQ
jgi:hypothetical protein